MTPYTVYQIDSFTDEIFRGNPAGVVVNADGLSDVQMQAIARELNNSETAFLFSSDSDDCDGVIRYFTPTVEVPICGHATIAAMHAKAVEENLHSTVLRMKTKVGVLPFEIIREDDQIKIWMTQGKVEIDQALPENIQTRILDKLGLNSSDLDERCPIQIASTGHSKVMIGITSRALLNSLTPDYSSLADLSRVIGCNGYFVFTLDSDEPEILSHGRMFAPAIGINEDPVTGNANGPLGAYLVHNQIVSCHQKSSFYFRGKQGEAIGRDGVIEVAVSIEDGKPIQVKIGGRAVTVFKTRICL